MVLRATPEDVEAGVQVGDARYRFYPGSAVGLTDPAVRVGFFALRHDQDINARITAYARDAAGNEATTPLEHQPFVKRFVQSKIPIDQSFLDRVVPAIASNTPDLKVDTGSPEGLLKGFLEINGNLRKKNDDFIASLAAKSEPRMLWTEAFAQMSNSQVESRFADRRTYYFDDKEIDKQVHLGFDLATVQQAPVHASNAGVVVSRRLPRHLRQLRDPRSRPRRAIALRAPVDDRREGRRFGDEGPGARTHRHRPDWPAAITCTSRCCCRARR